METRRRYGPGATVAGEAEKYCLLEQVGEGGNGVVYKATRARGGVVALKLFEGKPESHGFRRLMTEARALKLLASEHSAIVPLEDTVELDDACALVMPLLHGEDLGAYLSRRRAPLTWPEAQRVFLPVGEALLAAHQRSVVHRDVKPSNIFLENTSGSGLVVRVEHTWVRLLDFGIAKVPHEHAAHSPTNVQWDSLGTDFFMAPEQLSRFERERDWPTLRDAEVSSATDVYGLAATIYYSILGRSHLHGPTPEARIRAWRAEKRPDDDRLNGVIPPPTLTLLRRAIAASPVQRPALADLVVALRALEIDPVAITDQSLRHAPEGDHVLARRCERPISRKQPLAVMLLIDQSGSTKDFLGGGSVRIAQAVADLANEYIDGLIDMCMRPGGEFREYFRVGAVGYADRAARHLLPEPLMTIRALEDQKRLVERPSSDPRELRRVATWIDPSSNYTTPMCSALTLALEVLEPWVDSHPDAHPPIVFNITDGRASDGDPEPLAKRLQQLPAVVVSCHLSAKPGEALRFPARAPNLPDPFSAPLWRMSSPLPPVMRRNISEWLGAPALPGARGYVYNVVDAGDVRRLLRAGTPRPR